MISLIGGALVAGWAALLTIEIWLIARWSKEIIRLRRDRKERDEVSHRLPL